MRLPSGNTGLAGLLWSKGAVCRSLLPVALAAVLLMAVLAASLLFQNVAPSDERSRESTRGLLFDPATVWTARIHLEPEDWHAMEPETGAAPFSGPAGPGAPSSGPGPLPPGPVDFGPLGFGPVDFGPGTFVAPIFMEQGDANHDKRLAIQEIRELAGRWFTQCDKTNSGKLDHDQLRDGLNVVLMPEKRLQNDHESPPRAESGRDGNRSGIGPNGPPPSFGGGPPAVNFLAADGKRNGIAGVLGMDFPWVPATLEFDGRRFPNVSVRWKGNGTFLQSQGSLKRSFKVKLGKGSAGKMPGGVGILNFHSNVTDVSWMNEVLSYRLFRDAGVPAPRTAYSRVYLTVPGEHQEKYVGLYSIVENLDNDFAIHRFGTKKGALFKPVARRVFEDLGDDWNAYRQTYDPKTPLSDEETRQLIAFCKLVSHASDEEFAAKLEDFLDLQEFARFMAVTVWLSTMDSILAMDQNFVVYLHPKTRCFQFIPWDLDHSFGQFYPMGTPEQRENLSIHKPWTGEFLFLKRVFAVPQFKRLYLAHLRYVNETLGRPERLHLQVDDLAKVIRPAVADESEEKLARFDKAVAGEPVGPVFGAGFGGPPPGGPAIGPSPESPQGQWPPGSPAGGGPMGPMPRLPSGPATGPPLGPTMGPPMGRPPGLPGAFGAPTQPIKGFVTARHQSVRDQLDGVKPGAEIGGMGPPDEPGPSDPANTPIPFGPGMFWAPLLIDQFDLDEDGQLTRNELVEGLQTWFRQWDSENSNSLSEDLLRAGLNKTLAPPSGFGPPGPGFGVPGPGFGPSGPGFGFGPGPPGPFGGPPVGSPGANETDNSVGPKTEPSGAETSKKSAPPEKSANHREEP